MNFGTELLEITKDNLNEAQFMAANLIDKGTKNRVFINVAGAEALISHLERLGIDTSGINNIHSIKRIIDKIDIADIILDNIHIDVRVIFDSNYIFVPKSHYKYGIVPDIYVVLRYDNSIERINLLGFFEPSAINFNNANDDYYFVENEKLQSPFEMIDFISNFSGHNTKLLTQSEILRGRELSVMVADNDVSDDEFKEFLNLLFNSNVLRSSVLEYDNFETLASKAAFTLQIKQPKKSDNNIVDFDEFMSMDNYESANVTDSEQSASDNQEIEYDNGDSMLDDDISEPVMNNASAIENTAGAVVGSIMGEVIGTELNGQITASENAIELAAMAGEEIADEAQHLLEGNEQKSEIDNHIVNTENIEQEDISDFVEQDSQLDEPEVLNIDENGQENISDLVEQDSQLDEPEVLNIDENEQENISDFVEQDSQLDEPEVLNIDENEQEDISDFVEQDSELAELEVLNIDENEQEDISDFVEQDSELAEPDGFDKIETLSATNETKDGITDENANIDFSSEETSAIEQKSLEDLNDSEFDFDISEPPTDDFEASSTQNSDAINETSDFINDSFDFKADDKLFEFPQEDNNVENIDNDEISVSDNLSDENLISISNLNSTETENNTEQTVSKAEELISMNEGEKSSSDANIDTINDDDDYLVSFDKPLSDTEKSVDSVIKTGDEEFSDDDLLIFPEQNNPQSDENTENGKNEDTFDFSDIDNLENDNITDNAEISFEVIDDFDSFETIAPIEENFDVNFSENDLVENNISDKNSVKENSVVISNKTFNVGEIFIDINKDNSRPETFTENEHLEELYNNSGMQNNTGLNNDVRIISEKSKQIPVFVGIGGLALLVIILGIIVFSVSKFVKPTVHEDQNAQIENKNTDSIGTDVPNTANINDENVVMNDGRQRQRRRNINNPSAATGIQQSHEQIATKPIPTTAFLSVKKLSWEVPDYISYDSAFKQYLQSSGKGLKAALSSDLLLATDYTYSDQIRISILFDRAGNFKSAKILLSSGSSQVDNIVLQSVNQTLRALKAPNSLGNDESTTLILKIYL